MSAIGDTTHVIPVVHTIQQHWPQCKITWVIGKAEYQLLKHLPGVEFIIFDKKTGWRGLLAFRQLMKNRRFDVLLHMQMALRASALATGIKANIKLGFDRKRASDFQWLFSNAQINHVPEQHVLESFFEFLRALGLREQSLSWHMPLPEADTQWAKEQLAGKPTLIINPCSSVRLKNWRNWPAENYPAVITRAQALGLQVCLTGGPDAGERAFNEGIASACSSPVMNLCGKTSLTQLQALINEAAMMIAPDTGPAHMASIAGTPIISLYASTNPRRAAPYASRKWVVSEYPQALEQYMQKNEADVKWGQRVRTPQAMSLIQTADVIAQLEKLHATIF